MAVRYEGKKLREVAPYKRKRNGRTVYVDGYYQRYDQPRGNWSEKVGPDKLKSSSRTIWLKDKNGRFVGRANSRYQTTAKKYASAGIDTTMNIRERGRYGRIKGRAKAR